MNRSQGVLQDTGVVTDLAINGDGYFVVADGADLYYTRAGAFNVDRNGNLVNKGTGHMVQGWLANADGEIPSGSPLRGINLPFDQSIPGRATTEVNVGANLDASATRSLATLGSAGATGIGRVMGYAANGAGGQHAVAITGANATQSSQRGANLGLPGALTGSETLASLGVTDLTDFTLSVDGGTAMQITGLTASSTVTDLVDTINQLGLPVTASVDGGEVRLMRNKHGDGAVYNVATSAGAAGNISRRIFGASVGGTFRAANGTASTLAATSIFTPTGGQPLGAAGLTVLYDADTGLATGLDGLGGGGITVTANGGLSAGTATIDTAATEHHTSMLVYDSLGTTHTLEMTFTRAAQPNLWYWKASFDGSESITSGGTGTVQFNADGSLQAWNYDAGADHLSLIPSAAADPMRVELGAGTPNAFDGLTQLSSAFTARATGQNGAGSGMLSSISIDQAGVISGHFSNGVLRDLGQIVLARFNNPEGLERVSGSLYRASTNSGESTVGEAGTTVPASISSGTLEMSNVDLAEEFVQMIVNQRGFQANARVITTGDEIMTDLINLKR
jgi:flagellar hook protein FlgE